MKSFSETVHRKINIKTPRQNYLNQNNDNSINATAHSTCSGAQKSQKLTLKFNTGFQSNRIHNYYFFCYIYIYLACLLCKRQSNLLEQKRSVSSNQISNFKFACKMCALRICFDLIDKNKYPLVLK